jgi:hypothetical protein
LLAAGLTQANANAAVPIALASNVRRLAVLFASSPTSAAIPVPVAELARAGLRGMMLMKLKLLSTLLLTISLLAAGAGLAARQVFALPVPEEPAESKPPVALPPAEDKPRVRLDQAGDPLPKGCRRPTGHAAISPRRID